MLFVHNLNRLLPHSTHKRGEEYSIFVRCLFDALVVPLVEAIKGLADVLDLGLRGLKGVGIRVRSMDKLGLIKGKLGLV